MIVLGITHPMSKNTAAAILVHGKLVGLVEEERFLRIKQAPFKMPLDSIAYCKSCIENGKIEAIGIGYSNANKIFTARLLQILKSYDIRRTTDLYFRWMRWLSLEKKLDILNNLNVPRYFVRHHIAHAYSAYFASGFSEAIVLTMDGSGGEESGALNVVVNGKFKPMAQINDYESWGMAWEKITTHLGFRAHMDEGKVMGLAAYGKPHELPFVNWDTYIPSIRKKAVENFLENIPTRAKNGPIDQIHKDLAASLQMATEKAIQATLEKAHKKTGVRNICLAGGLALNCASNGSLAQRDFVDNLFVQPISNDAGTALGSAFYVNKIVTGTQDTARLEHLYWGPGFENDEIEFTTGQI